jgi:hypothetical protein
MAKKTAAEKAADKAAKKATNRGRATSAARNKGKRGAEMSDARRAMIGGTAPTGGGPGRVEPDLDVDPTVVASPSTAPDHPTGEDRTNEVAPLFEGDASRQEQDAARIEAEQEAAGNAATGTADAGEGDDK